MGNGKKGKNQRVMKGKRKTNGGGKDKGYREDVGRVLKKNIRLHF